MKSKYIKNIKRKLVDVIQRINEMLFTSVCYCCELPVKWTRTIDTGIHTFTYYKRNHVPYTAYNVRVI